MKLFFLAILACSVFCATWLAGCAGESPAGNTYAIVFATGSQGEVLWRTIVESGSDIEPRSIFPAGDGGFILLATQGESYRGVANRPFMARLSRDGEILWSRTFDPGWGSPTSGIELPNDTLAVFSSLGKAMVLDADGDIVALYANDGVVETILPADEGGYIVAGTWGSYAWIAHLNGSLTVSWDRTLTSPEPGSRPWRVHSATTLTRLGGGKYCVLGTSESVPTDEWGHFEVKRWIAVFGPDGTLSWNRIPRFGTDEFFTWTVQPGMAPGGGPVILAMKQPAGNGSVDRTAPMLLISLDPEGNCVTKWPVGISHPVYTAQNQEYFSAVWELKQQCREPDLAKECMDFRLIKYDTDGEELWSRVADSEVAALPITRVLSTPGGGCVVVLEGQRVR